MALSKPELQNLANTLSGFIAAIERGLTPDELRAEMQERGIPQASIDRWIECATSMHSALQPRIKAREIRNPRYRKGTAMKPVAWADCLWRPTP